MASHLCHNGVRLLDKNLAPDVTYAYRKISYIEKKHCFPQRGKLQKSNLIRVRVATSLHGSLVIYWATQVSNK